MTSESIHNVLPELMAQGFLNEDVPCAQLFDVEQFRVNAAQLREALPITALNAMAVKANPIAGVMREALACGLGAECASTIEVEHSMRCGFPPEKIVYDSPCKTDNELRAMLRAGVYVNLDNLQEIARTDDIIRSDPDSELASKVHVGLRINPQVGGGSIAVTSTATATSKFGTGLDDSRKDIVEVYRRHTWMRGIHCHVGSQGCEVQLIVDGIRKTMDFAKEINDLIGSKQVTTVDIGGGLPVNYNGDTQAPTFIEYGKALKEQVPEVFSGEFAIITEMGRSLLAKTGWSVSSVASTKVNGGRPIATIHFGADLFLRTAYLPAMWPHRISVWDSTGVRKDEAVTQTVQDVCGPLCFSGDYLAKGIELPVIEPKDYVVVHDTGAYTISMYSRYNSRCCPPFIAYTRATAADKPRFTTLKERETMDEVLAFWGS